MGKVVITKHTYNNDNLSPTKCKQSARRPFMYIYYTSFYLLNVTSVNSNCEIDIKTKYYTPSVQNKQKPKNTYL